MKSPQVSYFILIVALMLITAGSGCGDDPPNGDGTSDAGEVGFDGGDGNSCGDRICSEGETAEDCVVDCAGPSYFYDPQGDDLTTFPDDYFTVVDTTTVTGLRVQVTEAELPTLFAGIPPLLSAGVDGLNLLDGFGTSAGAVLRFDGPMALDSITSGPASTQDGSSAIFGYLDANNAFHAVPVEAILVDSDTAVVLRPMVPLPPAVRAVAGVTVGASGADGNAARPNPLLRALLTGTAATDLVQQQTRFEEALASLIEAGAVNSDLEIAALTVFTTQSTTDESVTMAADIRSRGVGTVTLQTCETRTFHRYCAFAFEAGNYRDEDRHMTTTPEAGPLSNYELAGHAYLPLDPAADGTYPTVIYGHGLGDNGSRAGWIADVFAQEGIAIVGVDAPLHGDHPLEAGSPDLAVLEFFGISATNFSFDTITLRDNWRQATQDKLALVELLRAGLDLDGDEVADVDATQLLYFGVSLGGIMGSEFLALSPDVSAAVLLVGGARIIDIVQFSDTFDALIGVVTSQLEPGLRERLYPVLQTIVERGDPVNYAPHVLVGDLVEQPTNQIFMVNSLADEIVPPVTNLSLARAMAIPHIPPVVIDVGLIEVLSTEAPISGNHQGGTAGLVQLDWVPGSSEEWELAGHVNLFNDLDFVLDPVLHFIETYFDDGVGEILDPYVSAGLVRPAPPASTD